MIPRNPRERSALLKGAIIGAVAGAFLPDSLNPYVIVRKVLSRVGG